MLFTPRGRSVHIVALLLATTVAPGLATPGLASTGWTTTPDTGGARIVVGLGEVTSVQPGATLFGATVLQVNPALRSVVLEARDAAGALAAAREAGARYAERDPALPLLTGFPDDPKFPDQYGPLQVHAPAAWATATGTTRAAVCVVDTGVRASHEDLTGPRYLGGKDFVRGAAQPDDDNGHGTHVTGIAAAGVDNGKGIAGMGNVGFYAAKVLNAAGIGTLSAVANGVQWCADRGPRIVISMSLASSSNSSTLADAVDYAWAKGALVVAAAGNDGPCSDCVAYPAKLDKVIAVTCTDSNRAPCSFSSRGDEAELSAPGAGVLSAYNTDDTSYATMSGTSMSTPHVSGVAALVWSAQPNATNAQLRAWLDCAAQDAGPTGRDATYGHGIVDANRTLAYALGAGCPKAISAPDLIVAETHATTVPTAGLNVTFRAQVTNAGTAASGTSRARFVLDGATLGEVAVPALAPGASANVTSLAWRAVEGNHTLQAIADATSLVAESNEANNARTLAFTVAPPPPPPAPERPIYAESFDDGGPAWSTASPLALWHVDGSCATPRSGQGMLAWTSVACDGAGQQAGAQWVRMPDVNLRGMTRATLRFAHLDALENVGGTSDVVRLAMSKDGNTWTTLRHWDASGNRADWTSENVDLRPWAGGRIYLRFEVQPASGGGLPGAAKGWFLDDVVVTAA